MDVNEALCEAARPLFGDGLVSAVECLLDDGWPAAEPARPDWFLKLLDLYAANGGLYGHGMWLSAFSAGFSAQQEAWLVRVRKECQSRGYRHVSEHYGFRGTDEKSRDVILPLPPCTGAVALGRDRLRRLHAAIELPVGIEVLASSLSPLDALGQGPLLAQILETTEGFLLLDVYNLWLQAVHHGLPAELLLLGYPLHRVREIHISSATSMSPLLALLRLALRHCPACQVVIFEQRGFLDNEAARRRYRRDYHAVLETVAQAAATPPEPPQPTSAPALVALDEPGLAAYQGALLAALSGEVRGDAVVARLRGAAGPLLGPYLDSFDPWMVELLAALARGEPAA